MTEQVPHVDKSNFLNPRQTAAIKLCHGPSAKLKIATFNIRAPPADQSEDIPANVNLEYPWVYRRDALLDQILYESPDIIGFQEVKNHQLKDINNGLSGEYSHVSYARNDGLKSGEAGPIFWKKNIFTLASTEHFWLSETPDVVGSKGWDAKLPRIATLVKLTYKQDAANAGSAGCSGAKEAVWVLNTHFDHVGKIAREESSKLILKRLRAVSAGEEQLPLIILLGDLNSEPTDAPYQTLTGHRYSKNVAANLKTMFNAGDDLLTRPAGSIGTSLLSKPYGAIGTATGFNQEGGKGKIIDYILVLDNGAALPSNSNPTNNGKAPRWAITRYGVINNQFYDGQYPFRVSDHNMVTAVFNRLESGTS